MSSPAGATPGAPTPTPTPPPPPPQISKAEALTLFANARIGGESIPSTATSELMLKTVVKAIAAASALVDSPNLGFAGAKPITKVVHGAGVGVYLLSDTLAGRGIKRGLGLFVLALGGALVAISLITGAAPAWMATLGYGLVLGGLAYAALSTGSLALGLVLATPVVPLLVWSATLSSDGEEADTTSIVQIVLIALLVGTLLIIGTVRDPSRRPAVGLRLQPLLRVLLTVVVVVSVAIVARAVVTEVGRLAAAALQWVAVAVLLVLFVGALRHVREVERAVPAAQDEGGAEGAATAATWAAVYGVAYVALALVTRLALSRYPNADAELTNLLMSLLATFTVLAAVCFVLCLRVPTPKPAPPPPSPDQSGSNS